MFHKLLKSVLIIFLIFFSFQSFSQDYERAFGIKFGNTPGVFYRKFADYKKSLEAIGTFNRGGFQLTILKENYNPVLLDITDQFFVYYGYGLELGYTKLSKEKTQFNGNLYKKMENEAGFGICGVFGLEYHLLKYPVALSLEYLPVFQFYFPKSFYNNQFNISFSISYTF